jgi:hypothetical protein
MHVHPVVRIIAGAAAFAIAGALVLNVSGVLRLPFGPLGASDAPGDGRQVAIVPQDAPDEVFTTAHLRNAWPVPASIEAVRPMVRTQHGGAEVLGAQSYDWTTLGEDQELVLGAVRERPAEWAGEHPVSGTQVPAAAEGSGAVVLVRAWSEPGAATDVAGYEIDYRVGPFAFRAISTTNSLVMCTNDGDVLPDCDDAETAAAAALTMLADTTWNLVDEPTRARAPLAAAAEAAGYEGSMARAFVFTVTRDDGATREILVAPGASGDWEILTPLG